MGSDKQTYIGRPVARLADPPLGTRPGRVARGIGRSPRAHGRLRAVDDAAARALPGVVAVWHAADIADLPVIEFREGPIEALAPYRQPVLAREMVRYVGEPVAAVFAEDAYVAE